MTLQQSSQYRSPDPLPALATGFVIFAILSVIHMTWDFFHARLTFDFSIIGFWIAPGIRRHSPGWRTVALVFSWITFIFGAIGIIAFLCGAPVVFPYGVPFGCFTLAFVATYFFFCVWSYLILTRPDIRRLFGVP